MSQTTPYTNLTALTLYIDTHIIDATDDAVAKLRRLRQEGWISLQRTDVMDTELAAAPPEKLAVLTEISATYPEAPGPIILGHSRLGHSVLANDEDAERLRETFKILFPGANPNAVRKNHIRDAMHVSTAVRYGGYGFVTRERALLNKVDQIAARFSGFQMLSPEGALSEALDRIAMMRELHRREPHRGPLPVWPDCNV